MALITCIECGNKVSDLAVNCPQCGAPTEISKKISCFECGNLLDKGVNVCSSCGVDQALNPTNNISKSTNEKLELKVSQPENKTENTNSSQEKKSSSSESNKQQETVETKSKNSQDAERKKSVPPTNPVQQKKSGCLKPLIVTFLIVLVLGGIGYVLLPDDAKKELFEALGIENSELARQDLEAYINSEEVYARQTLFGKWEISLVIYNTHESITIRHVDIKFMFTDSDETRTFSKYLKPDKTFGTVIIEKFDGHKGASYLGYEVVDARE